MLEPKATPGQVATLKLLVPNIAELLNGYQLATLAENLERYITAIPGKEVTLKTVLVSMQHHNAVTAEGLVELVTLCNLRKLQSFMDDKIAQVGWGIQGVGGDEDSPPFAYSVGMCLKVNLELIYIGPLSFPAMQDIINGYGNLIIKQNVPIEELLLPRTDVLKELTGGKVFYSKLVKVNGNKAREEHILQRRGEDFAVYQILVQDHNGKFPGEEGYNEKFRQEPNTLKGDA